MVDISYGGMTFPSTENAYQAVKSLDPIVRQKFVAIRPVEAKRLGMTVKLRSDWESVKEEIMYDLNKAKFRVPYLKELLLATGDKYLEETNNWSDTFWGVCDGKGKNKLGHILMKIRKELKD
jgi:ribA/ribD-fused uncharacterized protein